MSREAFFIAGITIGALLEAMAGDVVRTGVKELLTKTPPPTPVPETLRACTVVATYPNSDRKENYTVIYGEEQDDQIGTTIVYKTKNGEPYREETILFTKPEGFLNCFDIPASDAGKILLSQNK